MTSVGMSRVKRANRPYMAAEVEVQLLEAPGRPVPPPVRKSRRMSKLELADAEITRCKWCGNHTWKSEYCKKCEDEGYPVIPL